MFLLGIFVCKLGAKLFIVWSFVQVKQKQKAPPRPPPPKLLVEEHRPVPKPRSMVRLTQNKLMIKTEWKKKLADLYFYIVVHEIEIMFL